MINILRKEDCCGCGACFDACAHNAIEWKVDYEGFSYPEVNKDKCVNCGLCNSVCPIENSEVINIRNNNSTPKVLAAYHKDDTVRISSTSGGAFWGLAENFVKEGGFVAGAIFADHFKVRHFITNNLDNLLLIKGSKYVQSDCRGIYRQIKKLLVQGEKVMATGLPCQMAALRQYLKNDYPNLLVVDLICHSVPSPLAFEKYVDFLEKKYKSPMKTYHPKNKEYGGWHRFAFKATFENGKQYVKRGHEDHFTRVFVGPDNILARPSCYDCRYKHFPQPSDITIGDFWGIEFIDPQYDSPKGVSKVILNNVKGVDYFNSLTCFDYKEYDSYTAVFNNRRSGSMIRSINRCNSKDRVSFVRALHTKNFEYCVLTHLYHPQTLRQRIHLLYKILKCIILR